MDIILALVVGPSASGKGGRGGTGIRNVLNAGRDGTSSKADTKPTRPLAINKMRWEGTIQSNYDKIILQSVHGNKENSRQTDTLKSRNFGARPWWAILTSGEVDGSEQSWAPCVQRAKTYAQHSELSELLRRALRSSLCFRDESQQLLWSYVVTFENNTLPLLILFHGGVGRSGVDIWRLSAH